MNKIYSIVFFLCFSYVSVLKAQQPIYTLSQCIDFALKNHHNINIAENDVQVAYARKKEGQSAYMPQINGLVKWDYNIQLQKSALPNEFVQLGAALGQTFPNTVAFGNHFTTIVGVQLDQFLYNKSYIDGIRAIKPSYELAELKKEKTKEEVIYNTIVAYYQLLLINEQEKMLKLNQDRLSKTLPVVKLQYDKGVVKKIDVDRIQVNMNNLAAQNEILITNKKLAYDNLKFNMDMSLENDFQIDTNYSREIIDLQTFSDTGNIKNKIELRILRKNQQLQNVLYKRTSAPYFPILSFYAKYAGQSLGNKFGESFKHWSPIAAIGLQLQIPIFDGLRTASALKQSKLNLSSLQETIAQTENGLKFQMKNANTKYINSVDNIDINRANMEMAKNILEVVTLQYQKGIISYPEWLSSESSYQESETNYLRSFVDLLNAKLEIDKANGNLEKYK
ncbi:MAG: TolC family protein [Chitinophagales bacterium]|jgi:outer membrane protein|nr:TolC family protein [Chitinophagales bacterium]